LEIENAQRVNFICAHFDGAVVPYYFSLDYCDCRWATFRHVIFSHSRQGDDVDDRGIGLTRCNLQHTDWTGADLNGIAFANSVFRYACFDRADLYDAHLHHTDFQGVDLRRVGILPCLFSQANLTNANLSGLRLSCRFNESNLSGLNLSGCTLTLNQRQQIQNCGLRGVKIDAATQWDKKYQLLWEIVNQDRRNGLNGADLSYLNLDGLDLSGADLGNANLAHTSWVGSNLSGANLSGADLTNARFEATNLSQTDLRNTKSDYNPIFKNTDLSNAQLDAADFYKAHWHHPSACE
jgi:uncharacterized protein YjbI with pentapeptide repeats